MSHDGQAGAVMVELVIGSNAQSWATKVLVLRGLKQLLAKQVALGCNLHHVSHTGNKSC